MQGAADMNTITDYLVWRGDLTLSQSPFNEVDAAVLARFVYEPFEGIVSGNLREWRVFSEVCEELINNPVFNEADTDPKHNDNFVRLVGKSERFKNMKIAGFVNEVNLDLQTQFAACLIDLDGEQNYYVAFRGTDNTLVGWKEDLNMGFEFPVPAQEMALKYLEQVLTAYKDGTFTIGGHSKGGNLSVYSATFCDEMFNAPIVDIYNFDGPGFAEKIMQTPEFMKIEDHIHTFVPEFSIVGMILEHLEDYTVVLSEQSGIMEHELLTWAVEGPRFIYRERVSKGSRFFDKTLKNWLEGLSHEQREQFVDAVYSIMMSSDARTLAQLSSNKNNLGLMIKTFKNMDSDIRAGVFKTVRMLLDSASSTLKASKEPLND